MNAPKVVALVPKGLPSHAVLEARTDALQREAMQVAGRIRILRRALDSAESAGEQAEVTWDAIFCLDELVGAVERINDALDSGTLYAPVDVTAGEDVRP